MLYAVVCTSNPGIGVWYYTNTIWYYSGHACICCSDISVSLPRIQIRVAGPCYPNPNASGLLLVHHRQLPGDREKAAILVVLYLQGNTVLAVYK